MARSVLKLTDYTTDLRKGRTPRRSPVRGSRGAMSRTTRHYRKRAFLCLALLTTAVVGVALAWLARHPAALIGSHALLVLSACGAAWFWLRTRRSKRASREVDFTIAVAGYQLDDLRSRRCCG